MKPSRACTPYSLQLQPVHAKPASGHGKYTGENVAMKAFDDDALCVQPAIVGFLATNGPHYPANRQEHENQSHHLLRGVAGTPRTVCLTHREVPGMRSERGYVDKPSFIAGS